VTTKYCFVSVEGQRKFAAGDGELVDERNGPSNSLLARLLACEWIGCQKEKGKGRRESELALYDLTYVLLRSTLWVYGVLKVPIPFLKVIITHPVRCDSDDGWRHNGWFKEIEPGPLLFYPTCLPTLPYTPYGGGSTYFICMTGSLKTKPPT
jgi:hypothetical protein